MNFWSNTVLRALLVATPIFSQEMALETDPRVGKNQILVWVAMDASKQAISQRFGKPRMATEFGVDFQTWQYQIAEGDHDDASHQLVFRKSSNQLVSITRNYEPQQTVAAFFPESKSKAYRTKGPTPFSILVRRLEDGSILLAPGISKPDEPAGQLMLIRESELRHFYPWLAEQLAGEK